MCQNKTHRVAQEFARWLKVVVAVIVAASELSYAQPTASAMQSGAAGQARTEVRPLAPGAAVEREIAGGESHSYQVSFAAGQFARFRLEQRAIDAALILTAPDGKQLVEMNLTRTGEQESLSLEAAIPGIYRITVRGDGAATLRGSYRLEAAVQAMATAQDRKRLAAEVLLIEAGELRKQGGKTAQQVIEKLQQALPIWRELGEPSWTSYSLAMIGFASSDLSQFDKAVESFEQALASYREMKNRAGEAGTLNGLGNVYRLQSRYQKAIEYYEQALSSYREVKSRVGEGGSLNNLGIAYRNLSRYEKAVEYYEQALAIHREVKDRIGEGRALTNLGNAYRGLSRYDRAIECYEQALAIHREVKNRASEGIAINNLAITHRLLSLYERAIEYDEQALAIHREVKNRAGEGATLNTLGMDYEKLGRYEKAVEYYEQALAILRGVKDRGGEGVALNNLGNAYRGLTRYDRAIEYYEQALAIHREVKNRAGEGRTLTNLGIVYQSLSRYEKAIEYQEQSLAIAREIKARDQEIGPLISLGAVYRSQDQYEKATRFHEQALAVARQVKQRDSEAEALNQMMLDWKARNAPRLAIFFGKQSVNAYQEIRSNLQSLDRESQQSFLRSKEEAYRKLADLLIAEGRLPEAEQVIRMLKEEEYFDFIRRDEANPAKAQKAALTPEEQALEKRYREIADRVADLGVERGILINKQGRTTEEEQRLARIDAELVVAGNAFQQFLDSLAAEMGSNADAGARTYQLRESQGLMEDLRELGKGTVALYTLLGEDKYRVILTTADFQKGYEYPVQAADLNRKVLEFREVLQNPKLDPLPLAQQLYKILLGPVAKDLEKAKAQTLMWSLDGALRYVPVAALHDGKQYLVETYRNAVFTPASQSRLLLEPSRKWTALGLGVTKAQGDRIPALPGVADEMRGIIREDGAEKAAGVLPGVVKLNEQFTEEAMLAELRKRHKVVHIASHFQFSPGNETNSALLLGDGSFLSLAQIKVLPNVFAGVELLTLSACNTATGGSGANGKEVEGFGVLAQRQGAKAVVASLWPVADSSTKLLMQEFYRGREAQPGTSKVEALRQAQLRLLRGQASPDATPQPKRHLIHEDEKQRAANRAPFKADVKAPFAHPYYWAPFILIGNWK